MSVARECKNLSPDAATRRIFVANSREHDLFSPVVCRVPRAWSGSGDRGLWQLISHIFVQVDGFVRAQMQRR